MKQKEKTQVVKIRIKMDIIYDPVGLEGITGQSMNKSGLMCLITDNTAIPCRHKLPKLIPHDLTSVYKILNPILTSLPQIIAL